MKNFLVTGGAGFIGTNLCMLLRNRGHSVVSLDDYSSGKKKNHLKDVEYITGNTNNIRKLLQGNFFHCVLNRNF